MIRINLLAPRRNFGPVALRARLVFGLLSVAVLFTSAAIGWRYAKLRDESASRRAEHLILSQQMETLDRLIRDLESAVRSADEAEVRVRQAEELLVRRARPHLLLRALGHALSSSDTIWLARLDYQEVGTTLTGAAVSHADLVALLPRLDAHPLIEAPQLSMEARKPGEVLFHLHLKLGRQP